MRTMTLALLLASATSGSAYAQTRGNDGMDAGEPGPRREWTERRNVQQTAPQVDQSRGNREQRQAEALPERAPRGRWGGEVTTPPVPPVPQAQPPGGWAGNRGWRGGRGDVMTTNPSVPTPPTDRRWQGRGDDDNRNDGRRWDRGRDERWDQDRDRDGRHAENRDGGWHRGDNGRWERRGGDDRHDRYGHNGYDNRDWNRSWRNDRRYDWQHYRNQFRDRYRAPRYYNPYGYRHGYQRFGIGIYLDSLYFGSRYWLSDPWEYRLPPAPFGCRWVRYYDDVLLVETRSGYVVDVIYDFFW